MALSSKLTSAHKIHRLQRQGTAVMLKIDINALECATTWTATASFSLIDSCLHASLVGAAEISVRPGLIIGCTS